MLIRDNETVPLGEMEFPLKSRCCRVRAIMIFFLLAAPVVAVAQTDEIQVYDAEIADQGVFNLMIHTNFTPIGRKTARLPRRHHSQPLGQRRRRMGLWRHRLV